jgi:hypothetical protein
MSRPPIGKAHGAVIELGSIGLEVGRGAADGFDGAVRACYAVFEAALDTTAVIPEPSAPAHQQAAREREAGETKASCHCSHERSFENGGDAVILRKR